MGSGASAGENPQRGIGIATASEAAVVPPTIQKGSNPEKDSSAIDRDWCETGACEDTERT